MNKKKQQTQFIGKAEQYNEAINSIESKFVAALDDYKKYYVYYNKNPEVSEFQNYYANSKGQLDLMSKELLQVSESIHKSIRDLDNEMSSVSSEVSKQKREHVHLTELQSKLSGTSQGSKTLIDDSKQMYNDVYYKNVELIVGILLIVGTLYMKFNRSPELETAPTPASAIATWFINTLRVPSSIVALLAVFVGLFVLMSLFANY